MKNKFLLGIALRRNALNMAAICMILAGGSAVFAQNEATLEKYFEGKMVEVRIDMPATQEGIDVHPRSEKPVDFDEYSSRIKKHGVALFVGDQIMITKVKLKGKHLEFQLGGGGYGTFWDDTGDVSATYADKTEREKNLEKAVKKEKDPKKKKEMEEELDDLRHKRDRENERREAEAREATARKRAEIRDKAAQSGSRFNIRLDHDLRNEEKTPAFIMIALSDYLLFPPETFGENPSVAKHMAPAEPEKPTSLEKGMKWEDVAAIYGMPKSMTEEEIAGTKVSKCVFEKDDQIVEVTFVEGLVAKFSIASK